MSNRKDGQGGYTLIVVAFVLLILLGFAALAVDAGIMYASHTAAQRAADAGALAGALIFEVALPSATEAELSASATAEAVRVATQNTVLGAPVTSGEVNVSFPNGVSYKLIQVDVSHTIPTFFAGVLGTKSVTVAATAYAERVNPTGFPCTKPWFIPNGILAPTLSPGIDPCSTCASGGADLLVASGLMDTAVIGTNVQNFMMNQSPANTFAVKPGNPQNALGPGEFFAIQLSNDTNQSGADVYRENIYTCDAPHNIVCGQLYGVKTGNMTGPTTQGTDTLVGNTPDIFSGFSNGVPYYNSNLNLHMSHQTIRCPIWDICNTICSSGMKLSGTNVQIQVVGFAVLYIQGTSGSDVMANLLGVEPCNSIPPTDSVSVPLRLVRID